MMSRRFYVLGALLMGILVVATVSLVLVLLSSQKADVAVKPAATQAIGLTSVCEGKAQSRIAGSQRVKPIMKADVRLVVASNVIVGEIAADEVVIVTDGPICKDGEIWWKIQKGFSIMGWIKENEGNQYFFDPAQ